ncbi:MAG TPA: hypothetical protein VMI33_26550 [Streptosporangiaceae bacterium]|nr:hypothetical protein [Streptosporangiaceae bacterium]
MMGAWIAAAAAAIAGLAASYAAAGSRGLVVTGTILAAAALLAARAAITPAARRRPVRRRDTPPAVGSDDFPAYARIASDLGWAQTSRRHYDRFARPMFGRLLGAVLEEQHRLDMGRHPERARTLTGTDLWPLIDPSVPPSDDTNLPGVDLATLTRVVDRLEQLRQGPGAS